MNREQVGDSVQVAEEIYFAQQNKNSENISTWLKNSFQQTSLSRADRIYFTSNNQIKLEMLPGIWMCTLDQDSQRGQIKEHER